MSLRVVASAAFVPRGPRYEPRRLLRRRVRALRGGPDGIAAAFAMRDGELIVDIVAAGEATVDDVDWAIEKARGIAGVDDDPTEFLAMVRGHPVLEDLARAGDPRLGRAPTVFEVYASAVIEQLVTGLESRRSIARLWRIAGEPLPGTKLHAAPTPAAVRRVPMWRMHEIGVGSRRAATLREGAMRGPALERLRSFPAEVAIAKMQSLRGIGPWTANYVARDAFGYADAVPIDDFHAPRIVSEMLTGEEGGNAEMLAALEPFRPHRARAVMLIESSFSQGTLRGGPRWRPPKVDAHRRMPWRY
jgi:3-methyladenine DNA glycosylase/8-oxoguanine DNA glycosylase